jgi:hypothetical protein
VVTGSKSAPAFSLPDIPFVFAAEYDILLQCARLILIPSLVSVEACGTVRKGGWVEKGGKSRSHEKLSRVVVDDSDFFAATIEELIADV